MQIVPVLDLLGGIVVRGVGGRRDDYQPLRSLLTASPASSDVLDALLDRFHFSAAYIADLDGLMHGRPDLTTLGGLARRSIELIVDAGVRSFEDAQRLFDLGVANVVVASESLPQAAALEVIVRVYSRERITFSMDLKSGRPIVAAADLKDQAPEDIIDAAAELGVTRFILLDLADVGENRGPGTLPLLAKLRRRHPTAWFAVGGGVRSPDDIRAAGAAGADAILVASALHDGRLTPLSLREE